MMETPAAQLLPGRANVLGAASTIGAALPFLALLLSASRSHCSAAAIGA